MENKKLLKSKSNRKIFGVCGGLGEYFGIDPTLVRLACVIGSFLSFGTIILIYLVMALIMPVDKAA